VLAKGSHRTYELVQLQPQVGKVKPWFSAGWKKIPGLLAVVSVSLLVAAGLTLALFFLIASIPSASRTAAAFLSNPLAVALVKMVLGNPVLSGFFLLALLRAVWLPAPTHLILRKEGFLAFHDRDNSILALAKKGLEQECDSMFRRDAWGSEELFLWGFSGLLGKVLWDNVRSISLADPRKQQGAQVLVFHLFRGRPLKLRLGDLLGQDVKVSLASAIREHAPQAQCDQAVTDLLSSPTEKSYTELWFNALAAPPKRERLVALEAGDSIADGRFIVVDKLGCGGQGTTYLVRKEGDPASVINVAKEYILPIHVAAKAKKAAVEALQNEVRLLQSLDHPHIVKIVDFFVEDQRGYLVMEQAKGDSLRTFVAKRGPLSEEIVRLLMSMFCDILGYLHSQSTAIVHRDFTPDNLIMSADGQLKLIDFNVAQQGDGAFAVAGKRAYMPPEQFKGKCSPQSDIYALGATSYFLLTGQDPEPLAVSHPSHVNTQVGEALDLIIARCTRLELDKRYASVAQLSAVLDSGATEPC
jgi:hypothetical protein